MTNNSDNTLDNKLAIGAADQHLIAVEYDLFINKDPA